MSPGDSNPPSSPPPPGFAGFAEIPSADVSLKALQRRPRRGERNDQTPQKPPAAAAAGAQDASLPVTRRRRRAGPAEAAGPVRRRRVTVDAARGTLDFPGGDNPHGDDDDEAGVRTVIPGPSHEDRRGASAQGEHQRTFDIGHNPGLRVFLGIENVGEFELTPLSMSSGEHTVALLFAASGPGRLPFFPALKARLQLRISDSEAAKSCVYMGGHATFGELKLLVLHYS